MPKRLPKRVRKAITLKKQKQIARERLEILAEQVIRNPDTELARKWIKLMVKISRRWKVPIPKPLAGRFCYKCYRPWISGKNFTIRIKKKKPVLICACGAERPLKKKILRK